MLIEIENRIVYGIATALTAAVFVSENKQGLMDRCWVAGVQMTEILVAHVVNQFMVLVGQTGLVFFVMLVLFKISCQGSLALAFFISLMQGLCGMAFGNYIQITWLAASYCIVHLHNFSIFYKKVF